MTLWMQSGVEIDKSNFRITEIDDMEQVHGGS